MTRKLIAILLLIFWPGALQTTLPAQRSVFFSQNRAAPASSPWVLVAHTGASSAGTTSAINTTGANLIVIYLAYDGTGAVSDSAGNTWTLVASEATGGTDGYAAMYYCFNPTTNASDTFTAAVGYGAIFVSAWSGSASSPLDQVAGVRLGSAANTFQPGSITPTQGNELIVFGVTYSGSTNAGSVDSSFTISDHANGVFNVTYGGGMAYLAQGSASPVNPTWTGGGGTQNAISSGIIASFK